MTTLEFIRAKDEECGEWWSDVTDELAKVLDEYHELKMKEQLNKE